MSAVDTTDLLYDSDETGILLFVPRAVAAEVRHTRLLMTACRTWAEARAAFTDERYDQLIEELVARVDRPPAGDGPVVFEAVAGMIEPWPILSMYEMSAWVPASIVASFGGIDVFDPLFIHRDFEEQVIKALVSAGIRCAPDPDLECLFSEVEFC